jgi:hypothetical protein
MKYSLRPILLFANTDISTTKMCLDTSILAKSIMDRREYHIYTCNNQNGVLVFMVGNCWVCTIVFTSCPYERLRYKYIGVNERSQILWCILLARPPKKQCAIRWWPWEDTRKHSEQDMDFTKFDATKVASLKSQTKWNLIKLLVKTIKNYDII